MKKPKISVIMAVYNGLPYLKEAVKSIQNQSFKNFEFIIVDDGSKDKSWNFLKSIKDNRIKLIRNKNNKGLSKSLNIAIKYARGEFLARMDADDISRSDRLLIQLKFLSKNKNIDLCGSWVNLINNNGKIIGENKNNPLDNQKIKKYLGIYPTIIHPTFFAKREFFTLSGGYDDDFDGAEDYELICRAQTKFNYSNIAQKLVDWRLGDNRRSMLIMDKMYELDIKIKKKYIDRDGINIYRLYGYLKMIVVHYLIPLYLKRKISRKLKLA